MSGRDAALPPGFETLQPYVANWALPSAAERAKRRVESSDAEREAFYEAISAQIQEALAYLDQKHPGNFCAQEKTLMYLLLSFVHVSLAVEIQKGDEPKHAEVQKYINIPRASADL